ncbi:MAG: phosphoribosylformylglycinamidine synthase I [Desulfurella sp.]|uniref:phosphoribosylformylglycinamidine synthase I n=1 Tax=Desulfurella sp. TaxID=1962857 RepID=UPI003D0CB16F
MKVGIVRFLGTNCDYDCEFAAQYIGAKTRFVWHEETNLKEFDCIILPGGFSYGDYLRAGALAKFTKLASALIEFDKYGGYILGICNGFQILCELHLLDGALITNVNLRFIHKQVHIKLIPSICKLTQNIEKKILQMPIAHKEGNFYCDETTLKKLNDENRIVFKYCDKDGNVDIGSNPNGSIENIAGICNKKGNVLGLMPHPERAVSFLGQDGEHFFNFLR